MSQHPDHLIRNLQRLAQHSKLPRIRERLQATSQKRELQLQKNADTLSHAPFPYLPPTSEGWWCPGIFPDGRPVHLTPPTGLTVIVGDKGAGKSSLLFRLATDAWNKGLPLVFFDNKHSHQAQLPVPLPQLTALEASISLSKQGDWLTQAACLELFAQGLESVAFVHSGVLHLHDAAERLYEQNPDESICLPQLVAELRRQLQQTRQFAKQQQVESAINALRRVLGPDGQLFAGSNTIPIETRFRYPHLVHLHSEPPEAKRLVITLLRQFYLRYAESKGFDDRSLRWLVIADDARQLLTDVQRKGAVAVDPGQDLLDRAQSSGQGMAVATQSLTSLPRGMIEECELVVLLGPQIPADLSILAGRMRLSESQRQHLQLQPPYRAVFHHRQGFSESYPVVLTPPAQALLPADQARQIQAQLKPQLMAGARPVRWAPPDSRASSARATEEARPREAEDRGPDRSVPRLGGDAERLLRVLCDHPFLLQSEAYDIIGKKGHRRLDAMVKELEGCGLIRVHTLGRCKPVEVLGEVERLGLRAPVLEGRGGFVHRWLCRRVLAYHRALGNEAKLEFAWRGGRFDVWVRNPAGDCLVVEVMLSLSNLEATVAKCAGYASMGTVIVCENAKAAKAVKRAFAGAKKQTLAEVVPSANFIMQSKRLCLDLAGASGSS